MTIPENRKLLSKDQLLKHYDNLHLNIYWDRSTTSRNRKYYEVQCRLCGHSENRRTDQLQKLDSWQCIGCREINISNKANALGFQYLGRISRSKLHLECLRCGSTRNAQSPHLYRGNVRCDNCLTIKYSTKIREGGCEYVKRQTEGTNNATYIYFKNPEEVLCKVQSGHLMIDNWLYSPVEKEREKVEKIYVYKFSFNVDTKDTLPAGHYYKIGVSAWPDCRARKLKIDYRVKIDILAEFTNYGDAITFEKSLHFENKEKQVDPETVAMFCHGKVSYVYPDGYTEWFFKQKE